MQLAGAVADRAEITRAEAKRVLEALEDIVLDEIANAQKVKIGGLVQLTVRVKPASKARKGRNPATGEEITIAAKPASVDLRARAHEGQGRAAFSAEGTTTTRLTLDGRP
jgi:nucleoid DNA-binding protein